MSFHIEPLSAGDKVRCIDDRGWWCMGKIQEGETYTVVGFLNDNPVDNVHLAETDSGEGEGWNRFRFEKVAA